MFGNDSKTCLPPPSPLPWLVYTHRNAKSKKVQTFWTMSPFPGSRYYIKSIPELRNKRLFATCHDWVVLCDYRDDTMMSLWHPATMRVIGLPRLDNELANGYIDHCVLLSHPAPCHVGDNNVDDDEIISFIVFGEVDNMGFYMSCRPGADDCKWEFGKTEVLGKNIQFSCVTACNGVIYGVAYWKHDNGSITNTFVTCDLAEYHTAGHLPNGLTLRSVDSFPPAPRFYARDGEYMVESCGRIFVIVKYHKIPDDGWKFVVYVWELNLSSMNWVRVKSLKDRALFVCESGSTWCWAGTYSDLGHIEGNCVYITDPVRQAVHLYKLGDCSLTPFSCPSPLLPFVEPILVMPSRPRLLPRPCHKLTTEKPLPFEDDCEAMQSLQLQQHSNMQDSLLLCKLLPDLLLLVAQNLHLFDLLNFRASCTSLRSVFQPPGRRTKNSLPLFMFIEHDDHLCRIKCPSRSDSQEVVIPKSFAGPISIEFCKDGWLLLGTEKGCSLQFFNPFLGEALKCPASDCIHVLTCVGFSSCPTSSDCITIGIKQGYFDICICYFKSGDEKWECLTFEYGDIEFEPDTTPVYYEGAFYFMDRRGYLGVFRLKGEDGSWVVYGRPSTLRGCYHSVHIVECNGELLSIFIADMGLSVRVFKLNESKMKWREVKHLGDNTLFISRSSSVAVESQHLQMHNRIYLPRLRDNDIVFYTLDTGKFDTIGGNSLIKDFAHTKEFQYYCWI